jgi:hypothetical protein
MVAASFAPATSDAGETRIGGYYMFRVMGADANRGDEASNVDDAKGWVQRLQVNMDFLASQKTHAHLRSRLLDSDTVEGIGNTGNGVLTGRPGGVGANNAGIVGTRQDVGGINIRQMWLETEVAGFGVKVGSMPIALNDDILVNNDSDGYGAILVSKNVGDMTILGANVRITEGDFGVSGMSTNTDQTADGQNADVTGTLQGSDSDDIDLFVLSALGKAGMVNYQLTGAYMVAGTASALSTLNSTGTATDTSNMWLAATGNTVMNGIDLTGTLIYEAGYDNYLVTTAAQRATAFALGGNQEQAEGSGYLAALRAKGKTGFGGWNGYGYYASADYNNISAGGSAGWSENWDTGGPGGRDLLDTILATGAADAGTGTSGTENSMGVGLGLTINAGGWTINPTVDYVTVVEDDMDNDAVKDLVYDSATAAGLKLSTQIDTGTTFSVSGHIAEPNDADATVNSTGNTTDDDSMHYVQASIKMNF